MGARAKTQTGLKTWRGKWANIDIGRLPLAVLSIFIRKKYIFLCFAVYLFASNFSFSGRSHVLRSLPMKRRKGLARDVFESYNTFATQSGLNCL